MVYEASDSIVNDLYWIFDAMKGINLFTIYHIKYFFPALIFN